ncbi:unnamed protein product (macronuclear) [Paramecium tetraurelia]|uniref:EB1 C-terminal domain-containing protein n=1 Tax=Paramecium tetraurelia TaxID=5888 RepID=A0D1D4_PARTE|nr:uncharacterized protein GSPATT00012375001 [Paramecium tetraurelia]CAK76851.1 unnamed protein product [Paramecium tetraurelia]|eukprot:XP_001444248.1 hypothetical protein (macronuclear) [Paramecium tetraurelia strain d4-2]
MIKNNSKSYSTLRKKSTQFISETSKGKQQTVSNKTRAKSITQTTIKKAIPTIKPPVIDLNKIEVNPFTFANRNSHNNSSDQTNSRSQNSDVEQQGFVAVKQNNQDQLQILKRQKQLLEYRLMQETESCQQYQQNYHFLQERLQKLELAKNNYINEMNSFTKCLKLILNKDE